MSSLHPARRAHCLGTPHLLLALRAAPAVLVPKLFAPREQRDAVIKGSAGILEPGAHRGGAKRFPHQLRCGCGVGKHRIIKSTAGRGLLCDMAITEWGDLVSRPSFLAAAHPFAHPCLLCVEPRRAGDVQHRLEHLHHPRNSDRLGRLRTQSLCSHHRRQLCLRVRPVARVGEGRIIQWEVGHAGRVGAVEDGVLGVRRGGACSDREG